MENAFNKIRFLTEQENDVMYHLYEAMRIFTEISEVDQQSTHDLFDFGHYIDAAKNAVLLRGARRMDPDNLIVKRTKPFVDKLGDTIEEKEDKFKLDE